MSFCTPKNDVVGLQLAASYTAGSGSMTLGAGQGVHFAAFPALFTVVTNASYQTSAEVKASYTCTGVSTDTLSGVAVADGYTDRNFASGDYLDMRPEAKFVVDLNTAVAALQSVGATVTSVAMTGDGTVFASSVTGSPITTSGTLAPSLVSQSANVVLAGPATGSAAAPTFRALVGTDLPNPSATTLGGVRSIAAVIHQWIASISTAGVPAFGQPSFNDISGSISIVSIANSTITYAKIQNETASTILGNPTGSAAAPSEITLGSTLAFTGSALGLAVPVTVASGGTGDTSLTAYAVLCGGTTSTAAVQPVASVGTSGQVLTSNGTGALPTFRTVSGTGTVTSVGLSLPAIFTVSGSPVTTSGTLTAVLATESANLVFAGPGSGSAAAPTFRALVGADLPNPSSSTLGGIESAAAVSHQWIASISTAGVPSLSQPAFADVSGTATVAQLPVMVASGSGHAAGIAPDPGATAGTTHYLREDATWAVPSGGGSPGGSTGQIQYNNASAFGGAADLTVGSAGQLNFGSIAAPGSPTIGDEWYDSTQTCRAYYGGPGGLTGYHSRLIFQQVTNVTVTITGATTLLSTTSAIGTLSLPAAYLNVAGRMLRITMGGYASTAASSPGTATFSLWLGSNIVATTYTNAYLPGKTNVPWQMNISVIVKATGSSGKLDCPAGLLGATAPFNVAIEQFTTGTTAGTIAPQTQATVDLTAAHTIDFQINQNTTGNSFTLTQCTIEVVG